MFRLLSWAATSLLISGLITALLIYFDWDLVALGTWLINLVFDAVNAVSDWLLGWSVFQNIVSN